MNKNTRTGNQSPADSSGGRRRFGAVMVLAILVGVVSLVSTAAISSDDTDVSIGDARATLEKWVETRRIISKEKRDWALGREMLNERIALVEGEIKTLREKIEKARGEITGHDESRAELQKQIDKLKAASSSLVDSAAELEAKTIALLKRVPQPIRERVKPLSQRLPAPGSETKLSLGERFQNIVGILNEINKFNREITATSEVRKLPDGTSAEVTALYIGISRGYYVGAKGTVAGVGAPDGDSWKWTPANEAAPAISEAIDILQNTAPASFVQLPLEVK